MILDVRNFGDPILREVGEPYETIDAPVRELVDHMLETMRHEQGVGLAAQQIGLARMICVVDVPADYDVDEDGERLNPDIPMPLVLINPRILSASEETWTADEGCLSFPGISAPITRSVSIQVSYQDLDGVSHQVDATGFVARVIQHEVDHLNGVLFIDHMSSVKKVALSGRLKRMKRESRKRLDLA